MSTSPSQRWDDGFWNHPPPLDLTVFLPPLGLGEVGILLPVSSVSPRQHPAFTLHSHSPAFTLHSHRPHYQEFHQSLASSSRTHTRRGCPTPRGTGVSWCVVPDHLSLSVSVNCHLHDPVPISNYSHPQKD